MPERYRLASIARRSRRGLRALAFVMLGAGSNVVASALPVGVKCQVQFLPVATP